MFENKEYIMRIAEEQSVSKAAQSLHVSQPALSATVKRIEERIGLPLFDRTRKPLELTEAGKIYLESASAILSIESSFQQTIDKMKGHLSGTLRIGGSILFSSFVLSDLISNFTEQYPYVKVELVEESSDVLFEKLRAGDVDLVMDNMDVEDKTFYKYPYENEMLILASPRKYMLPDVPFYTAKDIREGKHIPDDAPRISIVPFAGCPFILMNRRNDTGKRVIDLMEKYGIIPEVKFTLNQQITTYHLAASGIGLAFVSDTLIQYMPDSDELCFCRIDDEMMSRKISFYTRRDTKKAPITGAFIESL